jgi:hypothetical protein
VLQNHAETLAGADAVDSDVAGVTVIGLGMGDDRPTFTFDTTSDEFVVGRTGDNCTFYNLCFAPAVSEVVHAIDWEDGADNVAFIKCEFLESATAAWEFDKVFHFAVEANDPQILYCKGTTADATGATDAIDAVGGVLTRPVFIGNVFYGEFANAPIYSDQVNTNAIVRSNTCTNLTTGQLAIEFSGATTGVAEYNKMYTDSYATCFDPGSLKCFENYAVDAIDESAYLIPAMGDSTSNYAGTNSSNNDAVTTSVASNADGSILERQEFLQRSITNTSTNYYVNSAASDDTGNGLSWTTAMKTVATAVTAASAGDTIYLKGTGFSEAVTCNKAGMSFIGAGTGPVETTWTMVSLVNSATDGWCLKITANSVRVENIKFRPPAYVSSGVPAAINLATGSDYAVIRNCRFQGRAGSYNAIYGLVPVGNVLIERNEFIYMNTLNNGRAIYMPASAGVACSAWIIRNNIFNSCVEDINIDGRGCFLIGNIHPIVGLAADGTFGSAVTTKAVDLSGTDTGTNVMTGCTLGGTYNLATYTPGTTGDVWRGNYASIVATVAPNGLTVLVPGS